MAQNTVHLYDPGSICVCADRTKDYVTFRLYHSSFKEPKRFKELGALVLGIEDIFESANFPQASTEIRRFSNKKSEPQKTEVKEEQKTMTDNLNVDAKGEKATFVVRVQYRQNATWQGTVVWTEQNKTKTFRSALELLKLIDSALDESGIKEE